MGLGLVNVDIGQILSGAGGLFKDIRTAITGVDPVKAAELNIKLAELEEKVLEAQSLADKMTVDDRKSARELNAEYAKAGKTNWLQQFLGYGAVIMLAFIIIALFNFNIKPEIKDLLNVIIGGLLKIVYDLYGFYFGGSLGSQAKNTIITDMIDKFKK